MATEGRVVVRGVVAGTLGCYRTNELGGGTGALVRGPAKTELGSWAARHATLHHPSPLPQTPPRNPVPLPPNPSHLHGQAHRPLSTPTNRPRTHPLPNDDSHRSPRRLAFRTSPSRRDHEPIFDSPARGPPCCFRRRSSCGIAHRPAWSSFQHRLSVSVTQAAGSSHSALAERGSITENGGR